MWLDAEVFGDILPGGKLGMSGSSSAMVTSEYLAGMHYRLVPTWDLGVALGRGLVAGIGAPAFRGLVMLTFAPRPTAGAGLSPPPPAERDRDGDGIPDDQDKCPDQPEDKDLYQDDDGCPDLDNDGDGIADATDKCPNDPEDKDGFQDADGCPDPDNDGDGIADTADKCPNDPEDKDGFQDADGCPDPDNDKDGIADKDDKCPNEYGVPPDGCPKKYKLVTVTEKKIELKQTVFFDFNKAKIKRVSYPLLDDVAHAMADNPTIKVEIGGHTDSVGNDAFNLKLSQARAEAVRDYLIGKGISSDRMVPKGYGETQPIADNRFAAGRAQNRRVEFVITAR
jgi:outer membrane protein OmpA-like peptidoglycan-associated protein